MVALSLSAPLLLVSSSPRRRELLETLAIPFATTSVAIDEAVRAGEANDAYLERIVSDKLEAAREHAATLPHAALLVADTIVACDGAILGKPETEQAREATIHRIAGRSHEVKTRFAIELSDRGARHSQTVVTRVFVRDLPDAWVKAYARTAEGADKAGGYAIQGRFGFAIPRIEGSYSNVVGLPLAEVVEGLATLGLLSVFPLP